MSDFDRYTRVNKYEKRRKNTKLMSMFIFIGGFLTILLIGLWIFGPESDTADSKEDDNTVAPLEDNEDSEGNKDEEAEDASEEGNNSEGMTSENAENNSEESNQEQDESDSSYDVNQDVDEVETEPAEEDDNVIDAFSNGWGPIGTEQEGPHTTVLTDGSQDRKEIEMAVRFATGLAEEDIIIWWLTNGGPEKVVATVSNKNETQIFRVYLSWIDQEGWQPTLLETLKENDEKWRFE